MNTLLSQRLTKVQNKLFEHAHTTALELKPLAIKFSKKGIVSNQFCTNPRLLALPLGIGEGLESLSNQQISLLSAALFGLIYRYVACSEYQVINSNMVVAEKVFERYSDEYMILYQETMEEYDHIWSFRTIYKTVCRDLGCQEKFQTPGFFRHELGSTPRNQLRSWKYHFLQFMTGEGIRLMSPGMVRQSGVGAMWLLYRYIANVQLKQTESYMFCFPEVFDYNPLSREITQAHANDEARHYTTSLDIGLDLYRAASSQGQKWVQKMITMVLESYISYYYLNYWEMLDLYVKGVKLSALNHGLEALAMALQHPDFAESEIKNIEELVNIWHQQKLGNSLGQKDQVRLKRWHYTAQQLQRLVQALDLKLNENFLGVTYERYQRSLNNIDNQVSVHNYITS